MNPPESEIEERLRALRPRSPSYELEGKIGAELATRAVVLTGRQPASAVLRRGPAAVPARWWQGLGWALAGAAVAALIMAGIGHLSPAPVVAAAGASSPAPEMLEHVDASAEIVTEEDEGLVFSADSEPVRRVRFTSYERHVWTNPTTGALMEYTVPREDIRLTPIALQ